MTPARRQEIDESRTYDPAAGRRTSPPEATDPAGRPAPGGRADDGDDNPMGGEAPTG